MPPGGADEGAAHRADTTSESTDDSPGSCLRLCGRNLINKVTVYAAATTIYYVYRYRCPYGIREEGERLNTAAFPLLPG